MGWIYIACRMPVAVDTASLEAGLRDRDPDAPAGVDYLTLAEDYPIAAHADAEDRMESALAALRVGPAADPDRGAVLDVGLGEGRPLTVHLFYGAAVDPVMRVAIGTVPDELRPSVLVGVRYWREHRAGPGLVIAYEAARYLAQRGKGYVVDDLGISEVRAGGWVPSPISVPETARVRVDRYDPRPGGPVLRDLALEAARDVFLAVRRTTTEAGAALAQVRLADEMSSGTGVPEAFLDALADDALDDGGSNTIFLPAEWLAAVRRYLEALPAGRAMALIAPPSGVRWRYLVDNPATPAIRAAVAEVARWPRVTDVNVRHQALHALVRLGPAVVGPVAEILHGARPPQRLLLAAAVASVADPAGAPVLRELLSDPNPRVRAVAEWGLAPRAADAVPAGWCAGCGIAGEPSLCPWCGRGFGPVDPLAWRALAAPRCPVPLDQR